MAKEAIDAEVDKTNETNEANVIDKIIVAANEGMTIDRANLVNKAYKANLTKANKLLANNGIATVIKYMSKLLLNDGIAINLLLYSLTKYAVTFANMKGYFGIMISNNQLVLFKCNKNGVANTWNVMGWSCMFRS